MNLNRRELLTASAALGMAATLGAQDGAGKVVKNGKLKQGACFWCWKNRKVTLEQLVKAGAEMGLSCIDLLNANEWKIATDAGLKVSTAMTGAGSIADGLRVKSTVRSLSATVTRRTCGAYPIMATDSV